MASQFYARYVPPVPSESHRTQLSINHVGETLKLKGSKKRKRSLEVESIEALKAKNLRPELAPPSKTVKKRSQESVEHRSIAEAVPVGNLYLDHQRPLKSQDAEKPSVQLSQNDTAKGSKKKKRANKVPEEPEDPDIVKAAEAVEVLQHGTPDHETKHKKVKSRFEESTKLAGKLSQINKAPDSLGGDKGPPVQASVQTHGLVPLPQPPALHPTTSAPPFSTLPQWLGKPVTVTNSRTMPFKLLDLSPSTVASLKSKGYDDALAIQSAVLPMLLGVPAYSTGDICISAATGSGKTLAYALPVVESLQNKPIRHLRGLVVVPTRELVSQARETLQMCAAGTSLKIGTAVGSKPLEEEQNLLIRKCQKYDPEGSQRERKNQLDREEDLMDWQSDQSEDAADSLDCPVDFVIEYRSRIDILVCTPGRLVDHIKSTKGFTLDHVQWLVVDEADRLLDESFQQWTDIVLPALEAQPKLDPRSERLLNMLHMREQRYVRKIILSATMTKDVSKLISLKLRKPRLVALENENVTGPSGPVTANAHTSIDLPATLIETAISIRDVREKPLYLLKVLSVEEKVSVDVNKPLRNTKNTPLNSDEETSSSDDDASSDTSVSSIGSNYEISKSPSSKSAIPRTEHELNTTSSPHGALVFTNSNESAMRLARLLCLMRPSLAKQIGSLTKSTATSSGRRILNSFRKRRIAILVASDRASRGLDIPDLAEVINYDMPTSLTSYIHRVGRTARAGKPGSAKTLVGHHEARWFWNEIARSEQVNQAAERKVNRLDWKPDSIDDKDRIAFESALKKLGEEARGDIARTFVPDI